MDINEILRLIQAVDEHKLTEFKLEDGDVKLSLKKEEKPAKIVNVAAPMMAQATPAAVMAEAPIMPAVSPMAAAEEASAPSAELSSDKVISSPLVGTFYNAASPEAEAFVKVGDSVKKGQVLGIIEAMKLMNEIESEYDGVVEAVLVQNEAVVEYGQPLFRIR